MKKSIPIAIIATALSFTCGHAADLPESPPFILTPPVDDTPPERGWDGSYAGLNLGFSQLEGVFTERCACETTAETSDRRAGLFAGHNWRLANRSWIGIEGDINYDWNEIDLYGAHVGTDLSGSVRMRLGEEIGNVLVYVAAGWTAANLYVENPDDTAFAHGWTLGAGIDWAVSDTTFLRAEYRYNDYSPATLSGVEVDFDQDVFSIGIAHRF